MCLYTPLLFSLLVFYAGSYTAPKTVVSGHLVQLSTHQGELCRPGFHSIPSPHIKVCYIGSRCTYSSATNWFWAAVRKSKVKERSFRVVLESLYFWSFLYRTGINFKVLDPEMRIEMKICILNSWAAPLRWGSAQKALLARLIVIESSQRCGATWSYCIEYFFANTSHKYLFLYDLIWWETR